MVEALSSGGLWGSEKCPNVRTGAFPSLHHRRAALARQRAASREGGVDAPIKKMPRSLLSWAQTGWFSFLFSTGKPPRPRDQRRLRGILLIARPPLLAVMQGGEYARFQIHSHLDRPPLQLNRDAAHVSVRNSIFVKELYRRLR